MWNDIVDLRDFYAETLGQVTQRIVRQRVRRAWPDVRGLRLLGLGYAVPVLRPFVDEAERVIAAMPAAQGVLHWPRAGRNLAVLVDEAALPVPDRSIDRLVLMHALECSEQVRPLLREVWRVLADGGRVLVIVPNRTGLWAQLERSPFASGQPYSARQLQSLLRGAMFTPLNVERALYMPPWRSRMLLGTAPALERFGDRFVQRFAGLVMVEAAKQLYAVPGQRAPARLRVLPMPARTRRIAPSGPGAAVAGDQAGTGTQGSTSDSRT